jgi:hypothetical protein
MGEKGPDTARRLKELVLRTVILNSSVNAVSNDLHDWSVLILLSIFRE